jgi:hypothetical protein
VRRNHLIAVLLMPIGVAAIAFGFVRLLASLPTVSGRGAPVFVFAISTAAGVAGTLPVIRARRRKAP